MNCALDNNVAMVFVPELGVISFQSWHFAAVSVSTLRSFSLHKYQQHSVTIVFSFSPVWNLGLCIAGASLWHHSHHGSDTALG